MTDFRVSDGTVLGAIGAVLSGAFGWLLRLERRSGRTVVRVDNLKDDLTEIKEHLRRQDDKDDEYRRRLESKVNAIGVKVAIIQTQKGTPPTGDTGSYPQGGGA